MKEEDELSVLSEPSDAALVAASLGGDRSAFGVIVTRYQRLLCSVAYASLGSLSESEDVAQEAFIEAWKKLRGLREPDKLKAWLCGILRFKISHRRRKERRQPVSGAVELEEASALASADEDTGERTMRGEEEALMWEALSKVPETYREPLVLFYREHRSVEHVAHELDLSESAVKQRLSRGRKLLQERMMAFVEESLTRSSPGRVFTLSVLAALPGLAPPAKAAGAGAVAAKTGALVKYTGLAAALASVSGFVSSFYAVRANLDQSRTRRERRSVTRAALSLIGIALGLVAVLFAMRMGATTWPDWSGVLAVTSQLAVGAFLLGMPWATYRLLMGGRALRTAERARRPERFLDPIDHVGSKAGEYRSRARLFGAPLVHIKYSLPDKGEPPAFGWVAGGDFAFGLLFAWGGFAVAPVSVGIVAVGLFGCGALGLGVVGVGTVGVGLIGFGAVAVGLEAFASMSALGWNVAAGGGFVMAREAALGPIAFGRNVNDELAQQLVAEATTARFQLALLCLIAFLVITPAVWYAREARRRHGKRGSR